MSQDAGKLDRNAPDRCHVKTHQRHTTHTLVTAAAGWFLLSCAATSFAANLDPELRRAVETLKSDAAHTPTNPGNVRQRAETLWSWANALAREGTPLPVNLTQAVTAALRQTQTPPPLQLILDGYIEELALLDDTPRDLGTLSASPGPFEARSYATIQQTWTVGTRPIQPGGALLLGRHFMTGFGPWQAEHPDRDHYISIGSSNPSARFEVTSVGMNGMHGGFRVAAPRLVFQLISGELTEGDTVTITYGDTTGGGRGLLLPPFSSDAMPLPLYLRFEPGGHFYTLPIQPVQVTGGPTAGVHAFAPSVVSPGEQFSVSVRAQDTHYNRATGAVPGWRLTATRLDSADAQPVTLASLPPGNTAIQVVDTVLEQIGAYRLDVVSHDGRIRGEGNPISVRADVQHRIYWGDTHGHSGFAEGVGTPERFMVWARDDARLDYVTHSEHDIWMDDYEWQVLKDNITRFSRDGEFVAYLGYEWTVANRFGGHHNVLYRTPADRRRIGSQFHPTLSRLYQGLRSSANPDDVIVIPHAHQAGDYRMSDPELEPLIEIMSMHGNFEWFGRMYLQHGHQVGFVAASDNHLSQPGYGLPIGGSLSQRGGLGAVLAPAKSTDALFDAMKSLRAYATTGDRLIVDFSINEAPMGSRTPMASQRAIAGSVVGSAPISSVTVFKNDGVLWSTQPLAESSNLQTDEQVAIRFYSDATPLQQGDNPRGWRTWQGTITLEGARSAALTTHDNHSPDLSFLEPAERANTWRFRTFTRGAEATMLLSAKGISRRSTISIALDAAKEFGGGPPIYRAHQDIPAHSLSVTFGDLAKAAVSQTVPAEGYTDRVSMTRIRQDGSRLARFAIVDESDTQGDYYYLRVTQTNDAIAWSSPIWVGGHPPR